MMNRWGSHWRWRLVLLSLTVVLLVYGWMLADQWKMRLVVPGSGHPAVVSVYHRNGISLEAYDWKTGKRWPVTELRNERYSGRIAGTVRAVGNGKAVAWHDDFGLHVVDLASPHEHRRFVVPAKNSTDKLIGVTDDERFAAFESRGEVVPTADGGTEVLLQTTVGKEYPVVVVHQVIDLKTGDVVNFRAWNSGVEFNGSSGEFLSRRKGRKPTIEDEPAAALWKITADGTWEKIEDRDGRFVQTTLVTLARDPQRRWRLLEANEVARVNEETSQSVFLKTSPDGAYALLLNRLTSGVLLVDTKSGEVREFIRWYPSSSFGEFMNDGKAVLMADLRDDVRLVDVQTGKLLAIDTAGSQRRNGLLIVAALLLVISAILLGTAMWERRFFWTLADVAVSFVAAHMAAVAILIGIWHPELPAVSPASQLWVVPIATYLLGMFVGAATMVGIYWAFGRGGLLWRWLLGGVGLILFAIPVSVAWEHAQNHNEAALLVIHGAFMAFALLFAGAVSCLGLFVRALGWTIGDMPPEGNPRQYRLVTFFLIVAAIAVLIAVGQWLFGGPTAIDLLRFVWLGAATITSGMVLAAILFSGARSWLVAGAAAVFLLIVAAVIYVLGESNLGAMSRQETYLFLGPFALATAVTIAIPCVVLRMRSWRWRRGKTMKVAESAPVAV